MTEKGGVNLGGKTNFATSVNYIFDDVRYDVSST